MNLMNYVSTIIIIHYQFYFILVQLEHNGQCVGIIGALLEHY